MPSIDEDAKAFEMGLASRFGSAVSARRKALKITASELSRRTADLGYPISRGAIAKIESNSRSGKIDIAEILVLSAALDIPPLLLLFPAICMDGVHDVLPDIATTDDEGARWFAGQISFPRNLGIEEAADAIQPLPPNDGVKLITAAAALSRALSARISLVHVVRGTHVHASDAPSSRDYQIARRLLEINDEQIVAMRGEITAAIAALWGSRDNYDPAIEEPNG